MDIVNMRLTGNDKAFYRGHCEQMAEHIIAASDGFIINVQFGKQDIRGGFSVTLIDNRHCVPSQKFFATKQELLGYIVGYNEAKQWHGFDELARHNKAEAAAWAN